VADRFNTCLQTKTGAITTISVIISYTSFTIEIQHIWSVTLERYKKK